MSAIEQAQEEPISEPPAPEAAPPVPAGRARPIAGPTADLARTRVHPGWLAFAFGAALLVYLAFLPRFLLYDSPPQGDQPFYLMDTASLAQDGDLNLKNNYDQHDYDKFYALAPHPPGFVGMTAPYPLGFQLTDTPARPPTEQYSAHPPGLAVLLAPAWAIGALFQLWWPATLVVMAIMGALLALNAFLLAHELTGQIGVALAVWAAIAFSNPVMTYSYLIFTELPTGLLLIYAVRRLAQGWASNGPLRLLLIGFCIGYIPWLALRSLPLAAPLGVYALWQWWRYWRAAASSDTPAAPRNRQAVLSLTWLLAPILLAGGLMLAFNLFRFGRLVGPVQGQQAGLIVVFYWPWAGLTSLANFISDGFGLLFDIQWGLLIYAPVYVLAVVGLIAMFRAGGADRRLLVWLGIICLPLLFVVTAFQNWNGIWCPPARYQAIFVPLLAGPLALALNASRGVLVKLLFGLLALIGFVLMAIMIYDPIRMWPFGDGRLFWGGVFDWLARAAEAPVHLDLRFTLPSYLTPDPITQPTTTGQVLVVAVSIVFLSYLFLRRAPRPAARRPTLLALPGLGWLAALAVLGSSWFVMNAPYLAPKTLLTAQQHWTLDKPPIEVHGMAYLDGKLYIASLGPRSTLGVVQAGAGELGVFDPASGVYTTVQPIGATGVLTYSYPGDVKTGPDHLLYLLNNGPGDQALYVMQSDGRVVRRLAMNGKSPLAIGLGLGPDGKLYATDMAALYPYPPGGGEPLARLGGPKGNFNNIAGVTVAPDGTIYGAESSEKRVHVFNSAGQLQRIVDLDYQPWQMAINGDWLDIACEGGFRSLNLRTGDLHFGRVGDNDPPLRSPTALAYGPGNTLYIFDRNTITAYAVQH